jgi:hypothetical protein
MNKVDKFIGTNSEDIMKIMLFIIFVLLGLVVIMKSMIICVVNHPQNFQEFITLLKQALL